MGVGSDWETVLVFEDFTDKVCRDFIFKKKKKKRAIKKKKLVTHVEPQASAVCLLKRAKNSAILVIFYQSINQFH